MPGDAAPLLRRLQLEARSYANAKGSSGEPIALGRVYGLLEAGVVLGSWTRKRADAAGEMIRHRYRIDRLRDVSLRDHDVSLMSTRDVATRLGMSRQRVEQLLAEGKLPAPSTRSGRVRYWDRAELEGCAEGERWAGDGRRWRHSARTVPRLDFVPRQRRARRRDRKKSRRALQPVPDARI